MIFRCCFSILVYTVYSGSSSENLRRGGSNQMNLRPMPLLPYQRAVEVQVLPEITSPESFKVDVSVPEICLPNPKVLLRRSTLPALDINSEALMLSRQLHLDFHEVKFVLQELPPSQWWLGIWNFPAVLATHLWCGAGRAMGGESLQGMSCQWGPGGLRTAADLVPGSHLQPRSLQVAKTLRGREK